MPRIASVGKKPKVKDRKYLRPDEARRLIEAAGKRGRYPYRDRILVRMDALQYIVREAGRAARLDIEAHPHMLRHAAGYTLANEGVDTRLIQDFLGHADIRHTAHYTALSPRRLAAVRVR